MAKVQLAEDQLEYVRARIAASPSNEYDEIADKSGVSSRTLWMIRKPDSKPRYETVNAIYKYLKANEPAKVRKSRSVVK